MCALPTQPLRCRPAPRPCTAAAQADINDKMRAILVDWLVDVHLKFKVGGRAGGRAVAGTCACDALLCGAQHARAPLLPPCHAPPPRLPDLAPPACALCCICLQLLPETLYLTVSMRPSPGLLLAQRRLCTMRSSCCRRPALRPRNIGLLPHAGQPD